MSVDPFREICYLRRFTPFLRLHAKLPPVALGVTKECRRIREKLAKVLDRD